MYTATFHQVSPETFNEALEYEQFSDKWAICHEEGGLEYATTKGSPTGPGGWHSASYQTDNAIIIIGAADSNAAVISVQPPKPTTSFRTFKKMYESLPE